MDKEKAKRPFWIRRTFIKELDHELRSPLNTILGVTGLCRELAPDHAMCHHLESIKDASHELLDLIDDLILLLKLNAGPLEEKRTGFCLEDVLDEVLASGLSFSGCPAPNLVLDIGPDVPSRLVGPGKSFRLACRRIFDFLYRYFGKGRMRVDVFLDDPLAPGLDLNRFLALRVSSAIGRMAEEEDRKMPCCLPFARFSIPGSAETVDSGLGLAIACAAIEGSGGQMGFLNKEKDGFVISILFPIDSQENVEDAVDRPGLSASPVACVFEKGDFQRTLNCRRLSSLGCETVPATDEDDLREILECHPPDLLVMGWDSFVAYGESPGHGQQDLSAKSLLLQRGCGVPLIITSVPSIEALSMQASCGYGEEAGPCFLASPLKSEVLSQTVRSLLYGPRQGREMENKAHDPDLAGLRVLLVEDNEINQAVGLALLQKKKIKAVVASNGRSVLRVTEKRRFDLILMDIRLPDSDGFSLTRQLRAGGPNARTPIVAMTASTSDRKRCVETGMNDFLTKPVEPEMLYTVIRRWAGKDGLLPAKM